MVREYTKKIDRWNIISRTTSYSNWDRHTFIHFLERHKQFRLFLRKQKWFRLCQNKTWFRLYRNQKWVRLRSDMVALIINNNKQTSWRIPAAFHTQVRQTAYFADVITVAVLVPSILLAPITIFTFISIFLSTDNSTILSLDKIFKCHYWTS